MERRATIVMIHVSIENRGKGPPMAVVLSLARCLLNPLKEIKCLFFQQRYFKEKKKGRKKLGLPVGPEVNKRHEPRWARSRPKRVLPARSGEIFPNQLHNRQQDRV